MLIAPCLVIFIIADMEEVQICISAQNCMDCSTLQGKYYDWSRFHDNSKRPAIRSLLSTRMKSYFLFIFYFLMRILIGN